MLALTLLLAAAGDSPADPAAPPAPALTRRGWDPSQPLWTSLGPARLQPSAALPDAVHSGAVFALAATPSFPSTLYVGTTGGLWKAAADPAQAAWSWTCVSDALPKAALQAPPSVGAVAVDPASPGRIYLGLGNRRLPSRGFFTSPDGGQAWTAASGVAHTHTSAIVALASGVVLVSGNQGLLRSTDGGATFSPVQLGGSTARGVSHLAATGSQRLVCATVENWETGGGTLFWQSSNGGQSWTPATVTNPGALGGLRHVTFAVSAADPNVAYALCDSTSSQMLNGVLASENGGASWTFRPAAAGTFFQDPAGAGAGSLVNRMLAVYPLGTQTLFAASLAGVVYRSLDGGGSWHRFVEPAHGGWVDHHAAAWLAPSSPSSAPALVFGDDAGIHLLKAPTARTTPAGRDTSFLDERQNAGLASLEVWSLGATSAAPSSLTAAFQDVYSGFRVQGGTTYYAQSLPQPGSGDGAGSLRHASNPALALAVNAGGKPHRSTDGGQAFQLSASGIAANDVAALSSPLPPALVADGADAAGNTVYFRSVNGIYRSTDYGQGWSPTSFLIPSPSGNSRVFAAEGSAWASATWNRAIYLSPNAGLTQSTVPPAPGAGQGGAWSRDIGALAFKPAAGSPPPLMIGLAPGLAEPLSNTLYRTVDAGATWFIPATPVSQPVFALRSPRGLPTRWIAGTGTGVLLSDDEGQHWVALGQGLPVARVTDVWISADGTKVRVSTFGRGIWEVTIPGFSAF